MNDKHPFERWRDRAFGIFTPIFLGVLVYLDFHDNHRIDNEVVLVLLVAYATGTAGAVIKRLTGNGK